MPRYKYRNFNEYWYSLTGFQRSLLARLSGVSYNYLCRIARGDRQAGAQTIARLGKVDRSITPRLMRPDLAGKRKYVFKGSSINRSVLNKYEKEQEKKRKKREDRTKKHLKARVESLARREKAGIDISKIVEEDYQ